MHWSLRERPEAIERIDEGTTVDAFWYRSSFFLNFLLWLDRLLLDLWLKILLPFFQLDRVLRFLQIQQHLANFFELPHRKGPSFLISLQYKSGSGQLYVKFLDRPSDWISLVIDHIDQYFSLLHHGRLTFSDILEYCLFDSFSDCLEAMLLNSNIIFQIYIYWDFGNNYWQWVQTPRLGTLLTTQCNPNHFTLSPCLFLYFFEILLEVFGKWADTWRTHCPNRKLHCLDSVRLPVSIITLSLACLHINNIKLARFAYFVGI